MQETVAARSINVTSAAAVTVVATAKAVAGKTVAAVTAVAGKTVAGEAATGGRTCSGLKQCGKVRVKVPPSSMWCPSWMAPGSLSSKSIAIVGEKRSPA